MTTYLLQPIGEGAFIGRPRYKLPSGVREELMANQTDGLKSSKSYDQKMDKYLEKNIEQVKRVDLVAGLIFAAMAVGLVAGITLFCLIIGATTILVPPFAGIVAAVTIAALALTILLPLGVAAYGRKVVEKNTDIEALKLLVPNDQEEKISDQERKDFEKREKFLNDLADVCNPIRKEINKGMFANWEKYKNDVKILFNLVKEIKKWSPTNEVIEKSLINVTQLRGMCLREQEMDCGMLIESIFFPLYDELEPKADLPYMNAIVENLEKEN